MLNWATGPGYVPLNAFKGVKMLFEGPGNMRIVSHEEELRYLEQADPSLGTLRQLWLRQERAQSREKGWRWTTPISK